MSAPVTSDDDTLKGLAEFSEQDILVARAERMVRQARREARKHPRTSEPNLTWRDNSRVCIPGYVISRQIRRLADLPTRPGAYLYEWLERRRDRRFGEAVQSREARIISWLLASPNDTKDRAVSGLSGLDKQQAASDIDPAQVSAKGGA